MNEKKPIYTLILNLIQFILNLIKIKDKKKFLEESWGKTTIGGRMIQMIEDFSFETM